MIFHLEWFCLEYESHFRLKYRLEFKLLVSSGFYIIPNCFHLKSLQTKVIRFI